MSRWRWKESASICAAIVCRFPSHGSCWEHGVSSGISVHAVEEAVQAESQGADYIVFGPVYETPSKQMFGPPLGIDTLEKACRLVRIPIIGIGGVTAARAREMRQAGAFGVAVITAILGAADVESATRELLDAVTSHRNVRHGTDYRAAGCCRPVDHPGNG